MEWHIDYYQKENGEIPVLEFLISLPPKLRAKTQSTIDLLEVCGTNLQAPYVAPVKGFGSFASSRPRISRASFTSPSKTIGLSCCTVFRKRRRRRRQVNSTGLCATDGILKGERTMSKASVSAAKVRAMLAEDKEYQAEYDRLKPRYALIARLINARKEQNITQAEMAARMGTSKSNISRLESGTYNPSLDFLIRAAASLDKQLELSLR